MPSICSMSARASREISRSFAPSFADDDGRCALALDDQGRARSRRGARFRSSDRSSPRYRTAVRRPAGDTPFRGPIRPPGSERCDRCTDRRRTTERLREATARFQLQQFVELPLSSALTGTIAANRITPHRIRHQRQDVLVRASVVGLVDRQDDVAGDPAASAQALARRLRSSRAHRSPARPRRLRRALRARTAFIRCVERDAGAAASRACRRRCTAWSPGARLASAPPARVRASFAACAT